MLGCRVELVFRDGRVCADAAAVSAAQLAEAGATAADDDRETTGTSTHNSGACTPGTCTPGTFGTQGTPGTW